MAAAVDSKHDVARTRLREIVRERSLRRDREFRLSSGGKSTYFFDMKMTLLDPEGLDLAAEAVLGLLRGEEFDAIGGLVLGACPIADAVCLKSLGQRPVVAFYVRKEPKRTGTERYVEGPLARGSRVVVVEDVTTRGDSALRAAETVRRELDCQVLKVVTIVDREEGARDNLARAGLELVPVFTLRDFAD